MGEVNTVTIPIEEYFELRQKAEMHMAMVREIAFFENRLNEFDKRIYEVTDAFERLRREVK